MPGSTVASGGELSEGAIDAGQAAPGTSIADGEESVEAEPTCASGTAGGALESSIRTVEAQPKVPAIANKRAKVAVKARIANNRKFGERYKNDAGDATDRGKFILVQFTPISPFAFRSLS